MKTIVTKFGGSSLADAAQFKKVRAIIEADPTRRYVVASAPGKRDSADVKVTDMLYSCYDLAAAGMDFTQELRRVGDRFYGIMEEIGTSFDLESELNTIAAALKAAPDRDYMASRGEYLNSKLLAAYLGYSFVDPQECIFFDKGGVLDAENTSATLKKKLAGKERAVVAGFYGALPDGSVRTFSRGGSDITGSLVAEAIGADLYENWTDVSGMLAADPRVVDNPRVVEYISYRELRILSYMGASVLHTDAVFPARKAGIPINIRNTNRPQDPGTMIVNQLPEDRLNHAVTGVAGRKGLAVVQVEKAMVSDGAGFSAILLDIFKAHRVPFEQCLTGIDTVSVVIRSDLFLPEEKEILEAIQSQLMPDTLMVEESLSMIAVVGERVANTHDATVRILEAVADAGIEVNTINQGSGNLNLIIGVAEQDYEKTIRAIYASIR